MIKSVARPVPAMPSNNTVAWIIAVAQSIHWLS
nr:MAG TPA: hypothetical protein [Caudoviricetes sp.]